MDLESAVPSTVDMCSVLLSNFSTQKQDDSMFNLKDLLFPLLRLNTPLKKNDYIFLSKIVLVFFCVVLVE